MKTIQPISIWDAGQNKQATILNAYVVNLQLNQSATFYYQLLSAEKETLAQGNLTMDGDAYQDWQQDEFAWDWVASQLNLTIVGDWIEPITEAESVEDLSLEEEPVIDGEELTEPEVIESSDPIDLTEEI